MYVKYAVHGLILSATVASAFNPYHKPDVSVPKVGSVGGSHKEWKSVKAPRNAEPFQPVREKPVELDQMKPLKEMHVKRIPRADNGLHPQIRAVQHANSITKKYRKRGAPGPYVDGELAIRNVAASLKKRGLDKRQNNFEILESEDPDTTNTLPVHQDGNDFAYFSEVAFGSNNKTFLVVIDTGSSDTWVPSSDCTSIACGNHERYGPEDSDTLEFENKEFSITYGTGSVSGIVVRDDASFAGFRINIEFGLSTTVSSEFVNFPIDGIMGLGFPQASQQQARTILEVLVSDGFIDSRTFSVALSRKSDGLYDGVVHFGAMDERYYEGEMTFSKSISEYGYWELALDDAALDGKSYGFEGRNAIIDTGTSLILLPPDDAYNFHLALGNARTDGESFAVPCDTNKTIDITFSGVTYSIPPIDWVGDRIMTGEDYCLSHIISRTIVDDKTWLMGDVFLKNVYANFDFDKVRIGFAKRASPHGTVNTPDPITSDLVSTTGSATDAPTPTEPLVSTSPTVTETTYASSDDNSSDSAAGLSISFGLVLSGLFLGLAVV